MSDITVATSFDPEFIRANTSTSVSMNLVLSSASDSHYWCECDIEVEQPLSLAPHKELSKGRQRVGIIKPNASVSKRVNIYSDYTNFQNNYIIKIIAYMYGEDGAISDRIETSTELPCKPIEVPSAQSPQP